MAKQNNDSPAVINDNRGAWSDYSANGAYHDTIDPPKTILSSGRRAAKSEYEKIFSRKRESSFVDAFPEKTVDTPLEDEQYAYFYKMRDPEELRLLLLPKRDFNPVGETKLSTKELWENIGFLKGEFSKSLSREAMGLAVRVALFDRELSVRKASKELEISTSVLAAIKTGNASLDQSLKVLEGLGYEVDITIRDPK